MIDLEDRMTQRQEVWTRFAPAALAGEIAHPAEEGVSYAEPISVRAARAADIMTIEWDKMVQRDIAANEAAIEQARLNREREFAAEREKQAEERDRRKRAEDHAAVQNALRRERAGKKPKTSLA